jgi:hypothetical protein
MRIKIPSCVNNNEARKEFEEDDFGEIFRELKLNGLSS